MNNKPAKYFIYGRTTSLKQIIHSDDLQALRYYNYLLMIEHHHKINTHPHAHKAVNPIPHQIPDMIADKEFDKNHAWSLPVPHWIVEIFTQQKVQDDILRNTA